MGDLLTLNNQPSIGGLVMGGDYATPYGTVTSPTQPTVGLINSTAGGSYTDDSQVSGTGTGTGTGTTTRQPAYDPADIAFIDQQLGYLQGIYNDIDTKYAQGKTGVENAYNQNYSEATGQRSRSLEDIGNKQEETEIGKTRAIGQVDEYARTLRESLLRRLGMAGGADSSAYMNAAPRAVARDASGKRTGVEEDYATNFRNLDTTKRRAEEDYGKLLESLNKQKQDKLYGLETGIADQRNQIQLQLADLAAKRQQALGGGYAGISKAQQPYLDQINARRGEINSLFDRYNPTYQKQEVKVNMPSLRDYMVNRSKISGGGNAPQQYEPYNRPVVKDEEEELTY